MYEEKIYVSFTADEDVVYSEDIITALKVAGKEVVVVGIPEEGLICDSVTLLLPKDGILEEEHFWVKQQQNKKLWRKK